MALWAGQMEVGMAPMGQATAAARTAEAAQMAPVWMGATQRAQAMAMATAVLLATAVVVMGMVALGAPPPKGEVMAFPKARFDMVCT